MKVCIGLDRVVPLSLVLTVLLSCLGLAGCDREPKATPPPAVPEVATVTVQPKTVLLTTALPGRTSAFLMAEIRPQVNGLIRGRLFEEGSDVKAGQVLYEIDPAPFQAALANATANLAVMRKSADRARAALEAGIAGVTQQRATLDLARTNRRRFGCYRHVLIPAASRVTAHKPLRRMPFQSGFQRKALHLYSWS